MLVKIQLHELLKEVALSVIVKSLSSMRCRSKLATSTNLKVEKYCIFDEGEITMIRVQDINCTPPESSCEGVFCCVRGPTGRCIMLHQLCSGRWRPKNPI